ncbi:hypothetical protein AMJ80_03325 [bacterium SM23_31]|nr:MAG: hypothetical protein AMJ80_03325 [bacterium SM23_31]
MDKKYSGIVMTGPFEMIKGFVIGYYLGAGKTQRPFFHVKSGTIRHDTFLGSLRTLLVMENEVTFCMENSMVEGFHEAVKHAKSRTGISIKNIKKIHSAEFKFSHEIYNCKLGELCKNIFKEIPADVQLSGYEPVEEKHDEYSHITFRSPAHRYTYKGQGTVQGEFEPLVQFFFAVKQSNCSEFIECHDFKLNFESRNRK